MAPGNDLPKGWEYIPPSGLNQRGYYIDHNTQSTQWNPPRPAGHLVSTAIFVVCVALGLAYLGPTALDSSFVIRVKLKQCAAVLAAAVCAFFIVRVPAGSILWRWLSVALAALACAALLMEEVGSLRQYLLEYPPVENAQMCFIDRVQAQSLNGTTFYRRYVAPGRPVVIEGIMDDWPIFTQSLWTDEYLRDAAGDVRIKVDMEAHNHFAFYLDTWNSTNMSMSAFLDLYRAPNRTTNYYHAAEQIPPELEVDVSALPSFADFMPLSTLQFWMGSGNMTSRPHTDPYENLLMMIEGSKTLMLIDPIQRDLVYTSDYMKDEQHASHRVPHHYSPVDFFEPDLTAFPRFARADPLMVTIHPGEALFLPAFWWHHVRSSSGRNLALNYWYQPNSLLLELMIKCFDAGIC